MTILKTPFIDGLFNREFDVESGSYQTASSAIQSGMFLYILEKR